MGSTIFWTVLSGVLTFVVGQILLKMFVEPVLETRKTIGQVAYMLCNRGQFIHNPGVLDLERTKAVSEEMRALAAALYAQLYAVPAYPLVAPVFRLPGTERVVEAATALAGLANSLYDASNPRSHEWNAKRVEAISKKLGLYLHEDQRWPHDLR